ncbi:TetR/AcrR family transcriptional regulator [Nocardioides sp. URHA0020]|uniref:TetR/AcrR family transcriptional regulator n=1 Tax=Nocardioides sp. URHA0020 TaxID=1380392 RepID=UPI00048B6F44|nr:TetR family transcriptional regulator [Nocardioides sp. URHA0020]
MAVPDAARSPKAEQTRQTIVASAMRLFRVSGYDRTTMRAIAQEAGVSVGNAYYYFGSKEHLVQAFYDQLQAEHAEAAAGVLDEEKGFAARLEGVLLAWLDVAAPHHAFAGQFFRNAADPTSPLSPFSEDSAPARDTSIALFGTLLDGSDAKVAPALRAELPELLWLLQMGMVLFWVYDQSPDQARSRTVVRRVVPIVDRLVRLSRMPVVRGIVDDVVALMRELRGPS